jgi:hypothetical protein
MLVATFNDTTGWRGKSITFDEERFVLEGHGRIAPKNIMRYDEKGQLEWASEGMRAWVGSQARTEVHSLRRSPEEDEPEGVTYSRAWYVGGLPKLGPQCKGALLVTSERICILRAFDNLMYASIRTRAVTRVGVDGGQVAQSRVGWTLLFGIAGLAAKSSKDRTYLMAYTRAGDVATYMVDGFSPVQVRADIAPILKRAGVPLDGQPTISPQSVDDAPSASIADEIERLATLHRSGELTDHEFAALKAKLMEG